MFLFFKLSFSSSPCSCWSSTSLFYIRHPCNCLCVLSISRCCLYFSGVIQNVLFDFVRPCCAREKQFADFFKFFIYSSIFFVLSGTNYIFILRPLCLDLHSLPTTSNFFFVGQTTILISFFSECRRRRSFQCGPGATGRGWRPANPASKANRVSDSLPSVLQSCERVG